MSQATTFRHAIALDIGTKIRLLRRRQKLSQRELAAASGLSRNTLSLIERGQTSPTLATLQKIADALLLDINSLFQEAPESDPIQNQTDAGQKASTVRLAEDQGAFGIDGLISALILRLDPDATCGSLLPHSGQEFIYCLSGCCLLTVDQQRHLLEPGDSLLFDGRLPHRCQNPGQETTKALVIFLDVAP